MNITVGFNLKINILVHAVAFSIWQFSLLFTNGKINGSFCLTGSDRSKNGSGRGCSLKAFLLSADPRQCQAAKRFFIQDTVS